MKKFFLTIVLAAMSFAAAFAQQRLQWSNGAGFVLPAGFSVLENSAEKFVAQNEAGDFAFSVVTLNFEEIDGNALGEFLVDLAVNEMGIDVNGEESSMEELEVTNGRCLYILGEDGNGTPSMCALLMSTVSNSACFLIEQFSDDNASQAAEVLKSVFFE